MRPTQPARIILIGMILLLPSVPARAQQPDVDSALKHLRQQHRSLELSPKSVNDLVLTDQHVSPATGITHFYFQQQFDGIPVYNAIVSIAIASDGRVVHISNRAVPEQRTGRRSKVQGLGAEGAVHAAARALGLEVTEPLRPKPQKRAARGPFDKTFLSDGGIASDDIKAQLVYVPDETGGLRLAWMVGIYALDGQHYWQMGIDAATGTVLIQEDLVDHDTWNDHTSPFNTPARPLALVPTVEPWASRVLTPLHAAAASSGYRVYGVPVESPNHAGNPDMDLRSFVVNPADPAASPLGWHNDGTMAYTITRGNNVHAYNDIDADGVADPGTSPDGGGGLIFDFPVDFSQDPLTYQPAAVTNLFYWNNIIHDVAYHYGFTEEAGNFQMTNVTGLGAGGDPVRAEALDGSGTNNANFFTPVDGNQPRMQMYRWTSRLLVTVHAPSGIAGGYIANGAAFGPPVTPTGFTGDVELVNDGVGAGIDACEPLVGFTAGRIALLDRGSCAFTIKVKNAQDAGAIGVIVANNVAGRVTMGGADPTIVIPSVSITQADGDLFKANLPFDATIAKDGQDRDSDFDNGIIVHEYAHGISNRLTGGPNTGGCLANYIVNGQVDSEQMGEGWSDYYALLLTDNNTGDRGIGTYAVFEPTTGPGIRPFPYSPSFGTNPATYATIQNPGISVPHGVGFVWATMLWDMTRDLVNRHGFDPDLYAGNGGNNLSLLLVTEGLKLQPCRPGFVDGRDAILAADVAINGGANQCLIWDAFARRGLGFSANQGAFFTRFDGTEAFDLPASCSTVSMVVELINALQDDGVLNKGQANSLLSKLQNAERMASEGQSSAAIGMLQALINQVTAFIQGGVLTETQGQDLIAHAQGVIARIQENAATASGKNLAQNGADALDEATGAIPDAFALETNYPNPFSDITHIRFALPEASHVRLVVYDVVGREVARLVDGERAAGFYQEPFDAAHLPSGVYLYRLEAGTSVAVQRMTVVK